MICKNLTERFEYQICSVCRKPQYCIHWENGNLQMVWLCQNDFCWILGFADKKDKVNLLFAELPDIENHEPIHDIRDLD